MGLKPWRPWTCLYSKRRLPISDDIRLPPDAAAGSGTRVTTTGHASRVQTRQADDIGDAASPRLAEIELEKEEGSIYQWKGFTCIHLGLQNGEEIEHEVNPKQV